MVNPNAHPTKLETDTMFMYDLFSKGRLDELADHMHDEISFDVRGEILPFNGEIKSKAAAKTFISSFAAVNEIKLFTPEILSVDEGRQTVLTRVIVSANSKITGITVNTDQTFHLFKWEDGKLREFRAWSEEPQVNRAAYQTKSQEVVDRLMRYYYSGDFESIRNDFPNTEWTFVGSDYNTAAGTWNTEDFLAGPIAFFDWDIRGYEFTHATDDHCVIQFSLNSCTYVRTGKSITGANPDTFVSQVRAVLADGELAKWIVTFIPEPVEECFLEEAELALQTDDVVLADLETEEAVIEVDDELAPVDGDDSS